MGINSWSLLLSEWGDLSHPSSTWQQDISMLTSQINHLKHNVFKRYWGKKLIWALKYCLQCPSMPARFILPRGLLACTPWYSLFPSLGNSVTTCTVPKLEPHPHWGSCPITPSPALTVYPASWIQPLLLHPGCPHLIPHRQSALLHWPPSWSSCALSPHSSPLLSLPPASAALIKASILLKSLRKLLPTK